MDKGELELRNLTYGLFVELGQAPTAKEVAQAMGSTVAQVQGGWRHLHQQHALVLDSATGGIRMANPFSAVPTAYRVRASSRWWYANCAWDALGICAALHVDGRIETSALTADLRSLSRYTTSAPTSKTCCCTASFPRGSGGMTSCSPEAR